MPSMLKGDIFGITLIPPNLNNSQTNSFSMAEKGGTKILAIITISIVLLSIGLAGCIGDNEKKSANENKDYDENDDEEDDYKEKDEYYVVKALSWSPNGTLLAAASELHGFIIYEAKNWGMVYQNDTRPLSSLLCHHRVKTATIHHRYLLHQEQ